MLKNVYVIICILTALTFIVSCGVEVTPDESKRENLKVYELYQKHNQEWSIEELGKIIVASGEFWEDWWFRQGRFGNYHTGDWQRWDNEERENAPMYSDLYIELMPSSGFSSLNDIRNYLLQLYTAAWVDNNIPGEFSPTAPFAEYNNILYLHGVRYSSVYIDWETAVHTIVSQEGSRINIESIVLWYAQEVVNENSDEEPEAFAMKSCFVFENGRINSTSICPMWRGPVVTQ